MSGAVLTTTRLVPASAERPGDDPIFALHAQAMQRAGAGEDILNSTIGALTKDDGSLATMPSVFEALRRVRPERAAAYAPISGDPPYLEAVIRDLFGDGAMSSQAVAVSTPGGTGACHHAIVNFLEPGQRLLAPSYFWGPYSIIADHTGRGFEPFRMFDADGRFDARALGEALQRLMTSQGRVLLVVNTPCNNPTGYSLDDQDWTTLVDHLLEASERGPVTLLLDFAYAKFAEPDSFRWPPHVQRLLGRVTVLFAWTASKAFAQYGARVGACVALEVDAGERERIRNAFGYSCRGTWSNCNHLGMLAITELLSDSELRRRSEEEREELRSLLQGRVAMFNSLATETDLRYPRYEGGFFVAVFTPDAQATSARMRELGVYVVPLQGAVRVALCATPVEHVARLVEALQVGVRAAGG